MYKWSNIFLFMVLLFSFSTGVDAKENANFIVDKKYVKYLGKDNMIRKLDNNYVLIKNNKKVLDTLKNKNIPYNEDKKMFFDNFSVDISTFRNHTQSLLWGDILHKEGLTGKGVKVAVIDSGASNSCLKVKFGANYSLDGSNMNYEDKIGHGTHVAGLIASNCEYVKGVAPDVELYIMKVDNSKGEIYISSVVSGIHDAIRLGVDVINISLVSYEYDYNLDMKVKEAISKGIIVVASMGNDGGDVIRYPAASEGVISVGSVNNMGIRSVFSNIGSHIDFVMFGEDVSSLYIVEDWYIKMSGTSMSSPLVAGVVSLIKSKGVEGYDSVYEKLKDISLDLDKSGFDTETGHGLPLLTFKLLDDFNKPSSVGKGSFYDIDFLLNMFDKGYFINLDRRKLTNTFLVFSGDNYKVNKLYYYVFKYYNYYDESEDKLYYKKQG